MSEGEGADDKADQEAEVEKEKEERSTAEAEADWSPPQLYPLSSCEVCGVTLDGDSHCTWPEPSHIESPEQGP